MDIDLLSKMVKELILDDDKVVLPGLGSFVAEVVPSTFSDKGYTINPPYRRLFFRAGSDEGGALASFYASMNNVELEVAEKIISDFVAELKTILYTRKTVIFPGLGRLRATKENNVFFVADEDLDIYPEGFGLEPISLKTHQETREEVSAAVVGLKTLLEEPEPMPEPEAVPELDVVPDTEPQPVPEPEQEAEPQQESEPVTEQETEPVQEPELVPEHDIEVIPVPEPVLEPEPVSDSIETAVDEQTEPVAEEEDYVDVPDIELVEERPRRTFWRVLWKTILGIIIAAVLLLVAFVAVSRIAPEMLDTLLYTPEELEILRS